MPPRHNHSNHPNSNQNKHGENYVEDESFDNVVDYITNNEYENLEILVEEEFNAKEFQIIEENKIKLSSCLPQKILLMILMSIDESTRKLPNSQLAKPFICEKFAKSYRKQTFYEMHVKHGE